MLDLRRLKPIPRPKDKGREVLKEQPRPNSFKIEMTKGCNLQCGFCGIKEIQKKPGQHYDYMTKKTMDILVDGIKRLGWHSRLELAGRGEPLANPNYMYMIRKLEETGLPIMIYTNGGFLLKGDVTENIDSIMEHVTTLAIEDYGHVNILPKIREKYDGNYEFKEFLEDNLFTVGKKAKTVAILPDVFGSRKRKITTRTPHNMGGFGLPLNFSKMRAVCAGPFREFVVNYNGNVDLCCVDWPGKFIVGNLHKQEMENIWNGEIMVASRKVMYHYGRVFGPCYGCSRRSFYTGFIPTNSNPMKKMDKLAEGDIEIVKDLSLHYKKRYSRGIL